VRALKGGEASKVSRVVVTLTDDRKAVVVEGRRRVGEKLVWLERHTSREEWE
jgi:hypothetical protein